MTIASVAKSRDSASRIATSRTTKERRKPIAEQLGRRTSAGLILEIDIGELLPS